jgi:Cu-Zn family superoxide dismutase
LGEQARPFLPAGSDGRASAAGLHVDGHDRLLVLTGTGQRLQIFNARTARRLADFAATQRPRSNLNDLAITRRGDVYITDFGTPRIYRVSARQLANRAGRISLWLVPQQQVVPDLPSGGNFNGIAATPDGRYLLVDQTGNGGLYRIDIARRSVTRIAVSGGSLVGCDGVLLRKRTLYVTTHTNAVAKLRLDTSFTRADIVRRITTPTLNFPTSVQQIGNQLVITNALKAATAAAYQLTVLPERFG